MGNKITKATIRQVRPSSRKYPSTPYSYKGNYIYWIANVPGGSPDPRNLWRKNHSFTDWYSALIWVLNHPMLGWNPCKVSVAKPHPPGKECLCEEIF